MIKQTLAMSRRQTETEDPAADDEGYTLAQLKQFIRSSLALKAFRDCEGLCAVYFPLEILGA